MSGISNSMMVKLVEDELKWHPTPFFSALKMEIEYKQIDDETLEDAFFGHFFAFHLKIESDFIFRLSSFDGVMAANFANPFTVSPLNNNKIRYNRRAN